MQFFFSIIIPVYNTERTLARSLDSILSQTFSSDNVEVVVVNDGSSNSQECEKVIFSYKDRLNINYQKFEENKGLYLARKDGVEKATGKYLLHLDSDDYLEKQALKTLYDDIQKNGDADYIWFLFNHLYKDGWKEASNYIKNINSKNLLKDILSCKIEHNLANKCFNASFAKEVWKKMPSFYAYYNEDYYQMVILHYYAKTKRMLKKPLYVYVLGIGITGQVKYRKEKLRKTILSIYNVDKYLSEFYQKENCQEYISLLQNYSVRLYVDCMLNSSLKDFTDVSCGIIAEDYIEKVIPKYISTLREKITMYKRREIYFFPIMCWAFFSGKLKRKAKISTKSIFTSTKTQDNTEQNERLEYIFYLEDEFLFYKQRADLYTPIKRFIRPILYFYRKIFKK